MQHLSTRHVLALVTVAFALLVAACTGAAPLDVAGVRPPEMGPPVVEIVVLAGDDLSAIESETTVDDVALDSGETRFDRSFVWPGRPVTLMVSTVGFESFVLTMEEPPPGNRLEVRLEPVVLRGRVTTHTGLPLPGAKIRLGAATDVSNDDGLFEIGRAEPGDIALERPAWNDKVVAWDGISDQLEIAMEPLDVVGIRVGGRAPGDAVRWAELLRLANNSGVNAFVIDIKDEFGTVFHDTAVAEAHAIEAVSASYDLADVVKDMDDAGLYKIARIAAFQDTPMAIANPEHAVLDSATGELWRTAVDEAWMDASDPVSYEYPIALAREACDEGFDEAQFDFASFPFGGSRATAVFDAENNEENRVDSIIQFLERAYSVLNPLGCAVGANVLGITLESSIDEGVGQRPGRMSRTIDVISPMLYSTNYGPGWKGFEEPDEHAIQIVDEALASGVSRLEGFAYLRPWLQTWTVTAEDVVALQRAAADRQMGWMLWSNSASYSSEILPRL
jgi:hypothetical protein